MLIPKQTYKDIVIRHIYGGLMEGKYAPGEKVLEVDLADELGLSRAPVREAMRELVSIGILEYRPQIGSFIATLSPEEIIDAYVARGVLEGFAARDALPAIDDAVLAELAAAVDAMRAAAESRNHRELIDLGELFHRRIFTLSGNRQLVRYTENLSLKLHLLFYHHWGSLYSAAEIHRRHMEIVETLRAGDPEKVEQIFREHYNSTGQRVARLRQQAP